ncbi:MAG: helix-turn-helix domain-containing protein [Chthoniobacterales bacterium]
MDTFHQMIGERIALARREIEMTQEELSERLGFKDRQILSHIESGKRKVSSQELLLFMQLLEKPLEFFTDPTLVVGKRVMSWRAEEAAPEIQEFESWALGLVGAHRELIKQLKDPVCPLRMFLPLEKDSTFEEAVAAAESLLQSWGIDSPPATQLQPKIESELNVLVLPVDAPCHVSGGAVNLPEGATIFLNRNHSRGRRHFTLAHELFHVLTWNTMPPEKFDWEGQNGKRSRVEKLADNFASALLMPLAALCQRLEEWQKAVKPSGKLGPAHVPPKSWFKETAKFFQVSVMALKYRLINAKLLLKELVESLGLDIQEDIHPAPAFGRSFLERLNRGIDRGFISARKAATLLQTSIDDLAEMLRKNDLEPSFSL